MMPEELRDLLAVLREQGATSARVPVLIGGSVATLEAILGPLPGVVSSEPAAEPSPEDEDLPPGAFDPIKRAKLRKSTPAPEDDEAA